MLQLASELLSPPLLELARTLQLPPPRVELGDLVPPERRDTLGELESLIGLRLLKSANLSDLANTATARTNLGVYSTAAVDAIIAGLSGTYVPVLEHGTTVGVA